MSRHNASLLRAFRAAVTGLVHTTLHRTPMALCDIQSRRASIEPLERRLFLSAEDRGKISVIVDGTIADDIADELAQYKQDLIGDGWTVSLHDDAPRMEDDENVWSNNTSPPAVIASTTTQYRADLQTVKDMIADDAEDETLKAVVIVGHVTVPYSGLTDYDNHVLVETQKGDASLFQQRLASPFRSPLFAPGWGGGGGGGYMMSGGSSGGTAFDTSKVGVRIFDQIDELFFGDGEDLLDLGDNTLGNNASGSSAGWSSNSALNFEFSFEDSDNQDVSFDFGGAIDAGIEQTIELVDLKTGKVIATTTTSNASGNVLNMSLRGNVTVRVTGANGSPASVSGVSFG